MATQTILSILKPACMVLFAAIVCLMGTLPIRSHKFKTSKSLRILGTTFAGALFLNVSILHILPQSAETIQIALQDGDPEAVVFPLGNLLLIAGFLITIFFTRIISTHSHQDHEGHQEDSTQKLEKQPSSQRLQKVDGKRDESLSHELLNTHEHKVKSKWSDDTYFLTLAMYFHTLFEGIAIGVQTSITGFLSTAIAIAFHKWADALSMGIHYRNRKVSKRTAYYLIFGQAGLNVVAIAIGWAITSLGDLTQAIFLAISAGTFLAISTMQMLGHALHQPEQKIIKFLILLASTAFISFVWFVENKIFA